ncbi:type I restriction endonuclease [Ruminiclostridium josui]|uniref:type I restriction endonuclease n=1 Tax=Ruminiclostridium josui TaxID=1499 RepID=UPI0004667D49|nr:type I restriction endonuclease [Ruminiclostridium josui]
MDFIDELKQFSKRVENIKDKILTEEATKTSIIMPFFSLLGYDVFDPHEFLPEFTADVGIKKGEKVDYAIIMDGKPTILVEAKWCGENLDKHGSQLFRYFGTSEAKFGILTNGIIYKFYTDLDESNKMDMKPFLEFNILDIKDGYVQELKKFNKINFDIETIFNTASELKYSNEIIKLMTQQLKTPSDNFIKYVLGEVYSGIKTQNVIEKFRDIIKKSLNQFVNELMNDKITTALKSSNEIQEESAAVLNPETEINTHESKINTTQDELEAFFIVRQFLSEIVSRDLITYKDTESYFGILYDNNSWKWICRFKLDGIKKYIFLPDTGKGQLKYPLENLDDISNYKQSILDVARRYIKDGQ